MKRSIVFCLLLIVINFVSASNVGLIEDEVWQSNLTAVRFSTTIFGDIDDDDLIITGCLNDGGESVLMGLFPKFILIMELLYLKI